MMDLVVSTGPIFNIFSVLDRVKQWPVFFIYQLLTSVYPGMFLEGSISARPYAGKAISS